MSFFPHDFIFHRSNNEDQDHQGGMMFLKRSMSFSEVNLHHGFDEEDRLLNQEDELSDDCVVGGDKKKRLKREQVRELERSFELGNKLDAERKQQLAKSLSLQPRQVAIWFQNRRARWKTKQLEKDYNSLKKQFASAMADNDNLQSQNKQLHREVNGFSRFKSTLEASANKVICPLHAQISAYTALTSLFNIQALRGRDSMLDGGTNIKKEMADHMSPWSNNASENSYEIKLFDSTRNLTSMNLFPSFNRSATMPHTLETSLKSDPQPSRINQVMPEDESLCSILGSMDDQTPGLWTWAEQHHFGQ
ncbi:hypothetical protein QQ045_021577 [Rhodiola kirilowii]